MLLPSGIFLFFLPALVLTVRCLPVSGIPPSRVLTVRCLPVSGIPPSRVLTVRCLPVSVLLPPSRVLTVRCLPAVTTVLLFFLATARFLAKYFFLSSTNLASRSASTLSNPESFTLAEGLALLIIPLLSKYFFLSSTSLSSLSSSASFRFITFYL